MKNLFVRPTLIVLAAVAAMATPGLAIAQSGRQAETPHRIALIDMAKVFKSYKKFEALRDELKGDLQKSEDKFKQMTEAIRKEQVELKNYKEGSDEFAAREKTLTQHMSTADAFRKTQQRELIRREAAIYKTIYLEVAEAVQKYAAHYQITLVLRFSADDPDSDNPEDVMRGLNRQVVYYRPSDDITNRIVEHLNNKYGRTASRAEPAAPGQN